MKMGIIASRWCQMGHPGFPKTLRRKTRHAEQPGDLSLRPIQRRQNLLAQKFAGMHRRQATLRELLGHGTCPQ